VSITFDMTHTAAKLLALAAQSEANAAGWENDRSEFARQAREFQLEMAAKFRARAALV
jgi:phosphoserine phosphatase